MGEAIPHFFCDCVDGIDNKLGDSQYFYLDETSGDVSRERFDLPLHNKKFKCDAFVTLTNYY